MTERDKDFDLVVCVYMRYVEIINKLWGQSPTLSCKLMENIRYDFINAKCNFQAYCTKVYLVNAELLHASQHNLGDSESCTKVDIGSCIHCRMPHMRVEGSERVCVILK